jgi:hypothetical protein
MMNEDYLDKLSIQTLDDLYGVINKLEDSLLNSSQETGDASLDSMITTMMNDGGLDLVAAKSSLLNKLKSSKKIEITISIRPSKSLLDSMIKKTRSQLGQVVLDIKYDQNIFAGFDAIFEGKKYSYSISRDIALE